MRQEQGCRRGNVRVVTVQAVQNNALMKAFQRVQGSKKEGALPDCDFWRMGIYPGLWATSC